MNEYRYYVYFHTEPDTGEIVYVGHGSNARAWMCTTYKKGETPHYGHRSQAHAEWCQDLIDRGYTPDNWVTLYQKRLTKLQAKTLEKQLIRYHDPKFNYKSGTNKKQFDKNQIERLRDEGKSWSDVAKLLETSTMTVWRYCND